MTREEAKEVFLNRGFIDGIYDGDKWREACIVISKWLEQESQTFRWCTDCKEYDQEKHCCHRWSKVIRNTVEEMKQEYIERDVLDKIDEIITDALDNSTDQKESQTLRWVLDKISEVM